MAITTKYLIITDSAGNQKVKTPASSIPSFDLTILAYSQQTSGNDYTAGSGYYCYRKTIGDTLYFFGYGTASGIIGQGSFNNGRKLTIPYAIPGASAYPYNTANTRLNYSNNDISTSFTKTSSPSPGSNIYDANGSQYTITLQDETMYSYGYYVYSSGETSGISSVSRTTPSSVSSGSGTSSSPWLWNSLESTQRLVIKVVLASSDYYIKSATTSNGTLSSTNSGNTYTFTISDLAEATTSTPYLNLQIGKKFTQTVTININKYGGDKTIMYLDGHTSTDKGTYVQYTTSQKVIDSASYSFTFKPASGITSDNNIYYISSHPGGTFDSSSKNLVYSPTYTAASNTITLSFGRYTKISATKGTGVATASISTSGTTSHSMAFQNAVTSGSTVKVMPGASYKIDATTSSGYFFDSTHGIGSSVPLNGATTTHTTGWLTSGSSDQTYAVSATKLSLHVSFPEGTNYGSLGSIGINGVSTQTVDLVSNTNYKLCFKPNDESTYAHAINYFSLSNGTTLSYAGSTENGYQYVTYNSGSVTVPVTASCILKQTKWKVTISHGSGGTSDITVRSINDNAVRRTLARGTTVVYIDPSVEYIRLAPVPNTNYKFLNFSGVQSITEVDATNHDFRLSNSGGAYHDATITVNFTRSNFFIASISTLPATNTTYIHATTESGQVNQESGYYSKNTYGVDKSHISVRTVFSGEHAGRYKVSSYRIYAYSSSASDHKGALVETISEEFIEKNLTNESAQEYWCTWYPVTGTYNDYLIEAVVTSLYYDLVVQVKHGSFSTVNGTEVFTESSNKEWGYSSTKIGDETQTVLNGFSREVKSGTIIKISSGTYYGGRLARIVVEDVEGTHVYDTPNNPYEFATLLGETDITIYFVEREKFVLNLSSMLSNNDPSVNCGSVIIKSMKPNSSFEDESSDNVLTSSHSLYVGEEYSLSVKMPEGDFSRKYFHQGWKRDDGGSFDDNDDTPGDYFWGVEEYTFIIEDETISAVRIAALFAKRETSPIYISYATRSIDNSGNEVITVVDASELSDVLPGCSLTVDPSEFYDDETGEYFTGTDVNLTCRIQGSFRPYDQDLEEPGVETFRPVYIRKAVHSLDDIAILSSRDKEMSFEASFQMVGVIYLQAVFSVDIDRGKTLVNLGYCGESNQQMGNVSVFATSMGSSYIEDDNGCTALVTAGKRVVIMASARPHYRFAGWYLDQNGETLVSNSAVHEIDGNDVGGGMDVYYARYLPSSRSVVLQWNGNEEEAKTTTWRSRVYAAASYYSMNSLAVYADNYPVTLTCYSSSSPVGIFNQEANKVTLQIYNQNARRLPRMRPEKYFAFEVSGNARINHVAIASSMGALK